MNTQACPIPVVPHALGAAGVIPFLLLTAMSWIQWPYQAPSQFALMAYGALHWAFAMLADGLAEQERTRHYLWSVLPALLGWIALLLLPVATLPLLLAGFWSHYLLDRRLAARVTLPHWYPPLRLGLTLTVSLALLLALAATLI